MMIGVLSNLRGISTRDISSTLNAIGIRGGTKSIYFSIQYTNGLPGFIVSKNTKVSISKDADISIPSIFVVGFNVTHPSSYWAGGSTINIANNAILNISTSNGITRVGPASTLNIAGEFNMGSSYMRRDAHVTVHNQVNIGNGCAIARGFSVRDADVHKLYVDDTRVNEPAPVSIKDNVWIGTNVSVKKGVTIGSGSVIGSDSVVSRDIPSNCLAVGSPAEVIEEGISWTP